MSKVGNCPLGGGTGGVFQYLRDHHVEEGLTQLSTVPKDARRVNLYQSHRQSLPLQGEDFLPI